MLTDLQIKEIQQYYGDYNTGEGRTSIYPNILQQIYTAGTPEQQRQIFAQVITGIFEILKSDTYEYTDQRNRLECREAIAALRKISKLVNSEQVNAIIHDIASLETLLTEVPRFNQNMQYSKVNLMRELLETFFLVLSPENIQKFVDHDLNTISKIANAMKLEYTVKQRISIFITCNQMFWPQELFAAIIKSKAKCRQLGKHSDDNFYANLKVYTYSDNDEAKFVNHFSNGEQTQLLLYILSDRNGLEGYDGSSDYYQQIINIKAYCKRLNKKVCDNVAVHEFFNQYIYRNRFGAANFLLENFSGSIVFKQNTQEILSSEQVAQRANQAYELIKEKNLEFQPDNAPTSNELEEMQKLRTQLLLSLRITSEVSGAANALPIQEILSDRRSAYKLFDKIEILHQRGYFSEQQIQQSLPIIIGFFDLENNKLPKELLKLWSNKLTLIDEFEKIFGEVANINANLASKPLLEIILALVDYLPNEYLQTKIIQLYACFTNNTHYTSLRIYRELILKLWDKMPEVQKQQFFTAMSHILNVNLNYDNKYLPPHEFTTSICLLEAFNSKLNDEAVANYTLKLINYYSLCVQIIQESKNNNLYPGTSTSAWRELAKRMLNIIDELFNTIRPELQDTFMENHFAIITEGFVTANDYGSRIFDRYFSKQPQRLLRYSELLLPKFLAMIKQYHTDDRNYIKYINTNFLTPLYPLLSLAQQQVVASAYVEVSIAKYLDYRVSHTAYDLMPTVVTEEQQQRLIENLQRYLPSPIRLDYYQHLGIDETIINLHRNKITNPESPFSEYMDPKNLLPKLTNKLLGIIRDNPDRANSTRKKLVMG